MNSEFNKCQKHYHVKKNDKVQVISGGWKNKTAKVVAILKKKDRVVLEIENPTDRDRERITKKRTVRKSAANPNGGLVDRAVSVHVSNVKKIASADEGAKKAE